MKKLEELVQELLGMLDKENFRFLGNMEAPQYPDHAEEYEEESIELEKYFVPSQMDIEAKEEHIC